MNTENKDEVVYLYLDDIIPNRFQPREVFDEKALKELAVSIKSHGVIQPIIVRNVNGKYEIIAGERRYKASALAGMTKIPAIVRNLDDKETSKVALLENLQRKNLNPIEEARTYQKILELDQMTQDELAKTMGKSQSAVANKLRLLSLPIEIQDALLKEKISERHARALINIDNSEKQQEMLNKIVNTKMTVRELEDEIRKLEGKEVKDVVPMDNQNMKIPNSKVTASTTDFINDSPLQPTTELPEDMSNYGQIKLSPPIEEQNNSKYINYGEIKDEDDEETNIEENKQAITPMNLNDIKSKSEDIFQKNNNESLSDLDSLLNKTNISINSENKEVNKNIDEPNNTKFITPAEEIVKKDADINRSNLEEYFKTPDIIPTNNIQENISSSLSDNTITIKDRQTAIEAIRKTVHNIQNNNIKIEIDEMNFDKSYQIIIKIDK